MPRWRRDAKELYDRASDARLMAVAVGVQSGSFEPSATHALSRCPRPAIPTLHLSAVEDGQRLLVSVLLAGAAPLIWVVLNWQTAAKR